MPSSVHRRLFLAVLIVIAWFAGGRHGDAQVQPLPSNAQSVDAASDPNAVAKPTEAPLRGKFEEDNLIGWMMQASGVFGLLFVVLLFVTVALSFGLLVQLRRANWIPDTFVEEFERLLNDRNYQGAYEVAGSDGSFLAKVLAAGLARLPRGYEDAVRGMQDVGDRETLATEQTIGYLGLIGSLSPLLGLLGTVQGMVISFRSVASTVQAPPQSLLADGIATAMVTTLLGIGIAIPAIVCYAIFRNRLALLVLEAGQLGDDLMRRFQGTGAKGFSLVSGRPTQSGLSGSAPVNVPSVGVTAQRG